VCEFVGESKDLRGLGVGAVDEDDGREIIDEREAAELLRVERSVCVAPDDPAHHQEDARRLSVLDDSAQGLGPRPVLAPELQVKAERAAHARGSVGRRIVDGQ
jgi:hypothetical protein